jgi:Spy/CpxP family protein refolding chaperone
MRGIVSLVSIASATALVPAAVAFADSGSSEPAHDHAHPRHAHHRGGLVGKALRLDSLTPAQRTTVEGLAQTQRAAWTPVRQADATLMTGLAQGVEAGAVDRSALGPAIQAKESAQATARTRSHEVRAQLQATLTPDQWSQVTAGRAGRDGGADHPRAREDRERGEGGQRFLAHFARRLELTPAQVESIRSTVSAQGTHDFVGLVQAAAPVLTPAQRSELAGHLRARAAAESRARG